MMNALSNSINPINPHPVSANTVVRAVGLSKFYPVSRGLFQKAAEVKALNAVSFSLAAGKTLAIVGESGCGKSTLARQLTLIESPTAGSLELHGQSTIGLDRKQMKALRQNVQMVFQNPYASLNPRHSVGFQLAEPLQIHHSAMPASERLDKVKAMMQLVGLRPEHAQRYPHMFSGGQRQRIAIARAMMLQPSLVVADEPTSALDVSIQAQVLNLFKDLQNQLQTAYVFISHNLAVVEYVADEVAVMYLGRIVEQAPKKRLFQNPLHPYTRALLSATPMIDPSKKQHQIVLQGELPSPLNPPSGCAFHQRCPHAIARCSAELPELRTFDSQLVACHRAQEL